MYAFGQHRRALVVGHFSTVGDVEVLHEVEKQLVAVGLPYDVAPYRSELAELERGWTNLSVVDADRYTHLLIVCGPLSRRYLQRRAIDLDRFAHCIKIGVNLTMVEPLSDWNPLDALIGRDADTWGQADLSFLQDVPRVPVAGLCLVEQQREYGDRQRHQEAGDRLRRLARRNGLAVVPVDTECFVAGCGTISPSNFESVIARLDVMLTTRLHGTVLSLKNGVPVIAIDAIVGGGKVTQQGNAIGWPEVFAVEAVDDAMLDGALARCLEPAARTRVQSCVGAARGSLADFSQELGQWLAMEPRAGYRVTSPFIGC